MDRYKCIKSFEIPICDDDGRSDENDNTCTIEKGTYWNKTGDAYVVLGKDGVHLETDKYEWLEILKDYLDLYFEKVY